MEIFSEPWAAAWGSRLNASYAYREAASQWEGSVLLEERGPDGRPARSVFLDLWHGRCREARVGRESDRTGARFVISATEASWRRVLDGMSPISALMSGKLRLAKGALTALLPYTRAASELVAAARGLEDELATEGGPGAAPAGDAADDPSDGDDVQQTDRGRRPTGAAATEGQPALADVSPPADATGAGATPPRTFRTTGPRPLDFASEPMLLWEKAKRLGTWDPAAIDFTLDARDWQALADGERDLLLRLAALFQAGEEAVTVDLLPLIGVVAAEGRLEEEMYLTSFLWEEAKHVEVFARLFAAVGAAGTDLARYHTPSYLRIFSDALPSAMGRLATDPSPAAQARASVTYNLIVEGVLAETGYHAYHQILVERGILPGMQEVTHLLKQDESRHLAYGVHLLSRLVREHGEPIWQVIQDEMTGLLEPAIGIIEEAFAAYPPDAVPFGLDAGAFVDFAQRHFEKRMGHVERARGAAAGAAGS